MTCDDVITGSKQFFAWQDIFREALDLKVSALDLKVSTLKLLPDIEAQLDAELIPLLNCVLPLNLIETPKIQVKFLRKFREISRFLYISQLLRNFDEISRHFPEISLSYI